MSLPAALLRRPLSPAELAQFAELLAGLVRAKLPLPEALRLLGRDAENRRLRETLALVEAEAAAGAPLGEALRRHSQQFRSCSRNLLNTVAPPMIYTPP